MAPPALARRNVCSGENPLREFVGPDLAVCADDAAPSLERAQAGEEGRTAAQPMTTGQGTRDDYVARSGGCTQRIEPTGYS